MRFVVAYESMFGNTRAVAEAIAAGITAYAPADVVFVGELDDAPPAAGDVLVVGAPTHVHSLPGVRSRDAAAEMVRTTDKALSLEPTATRRGAREWLTTASLAGIAAAGFDTRFNGPRVFTGSAAHSIVRRLRRRGARIVDSPQSFVVDSANELLPGELERARSWGQELGRLVTAESAVTP